MKFPKAIPKRLIWVTPELNLEFRGRAARPDECLVELKLAEHRAATLASGRLVSPKGTFDRVDRSIEP